MDLVVLIGKLAYIGLGLLFLSKIGSLIFPGFLPSLKSWLEKKKKAMEAEKKALQSQQKPEKKEKGEYTCQ